MPTAMVIHVMPIINDKKEKENKKKRHETVLQLFKTRIQVFSKQNNKTQKTSILTATNGLLVDIFFKLVFKRIVSLRFDHNIKWLLI